MARIEIKITGTTPLLMTKFSDQAARAATSGSRGSSSAADKGTPAEQAESKLYRSAQNNKIVLPAPNLFASIMEVILFSSLASAS